MRPGRRKVHAPAPTVMDQWGIGVGGPHTMPHPKPDPRPVPAGAGLSHGTVRILSRTTSGTSPSRSRSRAAARSARSSTCASPSASRRRNGEDAGTPQFLAEWVKMADTLIGLADEDEARGRGFSAADKLQRAALYLLAAERMQGQGHPGREATYARARAGFRRRHALGRENARARGDSAGRTGTEMPALLHARARRSAASPSSSTATASTAARSCSTGRACREALARRGISTLCVDQPGTGEALRLQGCPSTPHSESWASKAVDWLEQQPDVDRSAHRHDRHFARRPFRAARRGVRAALCQRRRLGRQPQLGRSAAEAPAARGRESRAALLGACALGVRREGHGRFPRKAKGMHLDGVLERGDAIEHAVEAHAPCLAKNSSRSRAPNTHCTCFQ